MGEVIKSAARRNIPFWVCLVVSIGMLVGGFFTPPMAKIDGSIFIGVGALFAYASLYVILVAMEKGTPARVSHGKTSLSVGDPDGGNKPKNIENDDADA